MIKNWQIPLLMTVLAGLATLLGGFVTFFVKKNNMKVLSLGLGFSAGVMIFVSFTEILSDAKNLLAEHFPNSFHWLIFAGFILGVIISKLIDTFLPDHVDEDLFDESGETPESHHHIKRAGIMTAIAIAIHNFPEGLGTFLVTSQDLTLGISVALAIALHNIPEGIAVALPIYHATGKKRYAIWYSFWTGMTEPLGAIIGMGLLYWFLPQACVGFLMAAVIGIMIYIAFDTLLPLSHEYGDWHYSIAGIMSGIIVIWASLLLLNH
ncbi:MAG: zinc transporter ZupT [bacterium]|nr:zinc transporter ZupT [bacterium]